MSFLNECWLGRIVASINEQRIAVGLTKNTKSICDATFPCLIAVGDQGVGKTSVVERFLQQNVLPKGDDFVTRRPLRICLRHQEDAKVPHMKLVLPDPDFEHVQYTSIELMDIQTTDEQTILDALKADSKTIKDLNLGISKDEGTLTIASSHVPNMDIIDVPGMIVVAPKNEPSHLPDLIKDVVQHYLNLPETCCVILAVLDSSHRECQSPIVSLLRQINKKTPIIKVLTKPDLTMQSEHEDHFIKQLNSTTSLIDTEYVVALKTNIESESFLSTTFVEVQFFSRLLGKEKYAVFKNNLGTQVLFKYVSLLSESIMREKWTKQESKRYENDFLTYTSNLNGLGPQFSSKQIASLLSYQLFADENKFKELISHAWGHVQGGMKVPTNSMFDPCTTVMIADFLDMVAMMLMLEVNSLFESPAFQLARYSTFKTELTIAFDMRFKDRFSYAQKRWSKLHNQFMCMHAMGFLLDSSHWKNAALSCFVQEVLFHLTEFHSSENLCQHVERFMSHFSATEDVVTTTIRKDLQQKMQAMEKILAMLRPEA
jgi:GTPase SAR1 family protein